MPAKLQVPSKHRRLIGAEGALALISAGNYWWLVQVTAAPLRQGHVIPGMVIVHCLHSRVVKHAGPAAQQVIVLWGPSYELG